MKQLSGFLLLLLLALAANAATVVGQWDVLAGGFEVGTNGVTRWVSPQGAALALGDWEVWQGSIRATGDLNGTGLKPEYETATNKAVRAGVMLVKPTAPPHVRTTLFAGKHPARTASFPDGGLDGQWEKTAPANVRIWNNGVEAAPLGEGWQIISFIAPADTPLERTMVFSENYNAWGRSLVGEAKVVILLGGDVPEAALRGMENALALRHNVAGIRAATQHERNEAQATGFSAFGAWGTRVLVR
jgi:hypothetical protein